AAVATTRHQASATAPPVPEALRSEALRSEALASEALSGAALTRSVPSSTDAVQRPDLTSAPSTDGSGCARPRPPRSAQTYVGRSPSGAEAICSTPVTPVTPSGLS